MRRYFLYMIGMIFFTGCSVTTTNPPIASYSIAVDTNHTLSSVQTECWKDKVLKVSQVFALNDLMDTKIRYMLADHKKYPYTQSKYLTPPHKALSAAIVQTFAQAGIFKSVENYRSRAEADLILETTLNQFIQSYTPQTKHSFVQIQFHMSLIDAHTSQVIATKVFYIKKETKTLDAHGGVAALNAALTTLLDESVQWVGGVCQ